MSGIGAGAADVVIVGAGQGGLSLSYFLSRAGLRHRVLDRGGIAHAWRAERWDSFCLVTPNWTVNLPGKPYDGADPDGFMVRDDFVAYLTDWARDFGAPVESPVDVTRITRADGGFVVCTDGGEVRAPVVAVATATYQTPRIPAVAGQFPAGIVQVHAGAYKSQAQLPPGGVLVVGSGQTGCQVVEDALRAGRKVWLAVSRTGRLPRRYRGRDCIAWQEDLGFLERTPDMLEDPVHRFRGDPHLTGRDGGATVSLRTLQSRGTRLLGRLLSVEDGQLRLGDDLSANIAYGDTYAADFRRLIDGFIEREGLRAPAATEAELRDLAEQRGSELPVSPESLDLAEAGITSVIWATGFDFDFGWIDGLERDAQGYPITHDGAASIPGLYFCGLNWMRKRKSGILYGVAEDAEIVARQIVAEIGARGPAAVHTLQSKAES